MIKRILMFLCIIALLAGCLASCDNTGNGGGNECQHTFSDEWYSDAENHWHPATCEHGEEHSEFASHEDADEDGKCDVCEYELGHEHSFETEWTYDENHHWKNATCTHSDEKGEYALHSDEDLNSICDLCPSHVHSVNAAGYCKHENCGLKVSDVNETDLEALVNAFVAQSGYVNGGSIKCEVNCPSNQSPSYSSWGEKQVDFLFGSNYVYYKTWSHNKSYSGSTPIEAQDTLETWYSPDGATETFGVASENGGPIFLISSDPNKLIGYYYNLSSLADGDGAETLLFNVYELSKADNVSDFVFTHDEENNSASFSFNSLVVQVTTIVVGENVGSQVYNVNYFETTVTFGYTDDMVLTSLDIATDRYTNDAGALDSGSQNFADIDIEYDPNTNTFKYVKYNPETKEFEDADSASADSYSYSITQTVGERTEENPHPKTNYIPDSFELYLNADEDGVLSNKYEGDTIYVDVSEAIKLYVGECIPENTSIHFVSDLVTIKLFKDGEEVVDATHYANTTAVAMFTFAGEQRSFFLIPKEAGIYRLEIWLIDEKLYDIKINAGNLVDEDIELEDNEFAVRVTDTYSWSNEVSFTATEAGTYYFNLPSGVGFINADDYDAADKTPATDDTPIPYFDYNNAEVVNGEHAPGSFSLKLEAGQTIRFYVNATKKSTFIISYYVF